METTGQRLSRLRKQKGLSQAKLAAIAGYSGAGAIGNIENDSRGYGARIVVIAEALGTTPEYLQTGQGPMHTEGEKPDAPPTPTLQEALTLVATHLNTLPDAQRLQAAQHLETHARAPDSQKALDTLLHALQAQPTAAPAVESRDFQPPVPPPTHLLKKPT